ncbi:MAG: tRNA (adenine-N1)-methyltransferase [Thermofilaceae archaeon]
MHVVEGDIILLYLNENKQYIVKVSHDATYSFNEGIVKADDILGKKYGEFVTTHIGIKLKILKPTVLDIVYKFFKRGTQVVYPKDAALIALKANIGPGSMVVEAGTGSGYLTAILAHFVYPNGVIYSYEIRREFLNLARRNLKLLGLGDYVILKEKDVREGIDERNVDAVVLDIPDPWNLLNHAYESLKNGGVLACFLPTLNQVEKTVEEARRVGYLMIESEELLERKYKVKPGESRPETRMIGHTGYLIFARKP